MFHSSTDAAAAVDAANGAGAEPATQPPSVDVAVVGAGVIGLSIAWRLAAADLRSRCSSAAKSAPARVSRRPACWPPPPSMSRAAPTCSRWRWKASALGRVSRRARSAIRARIDFRDNGTWWWRSAATRSSGCGFATTPGALRPRRPAGLGGPEARAMGAGLRPWSRAECLPRRPSGRSAAGDDRVVVCRLPSGGACENCRWSRSTSPAAGRPSRPCRACRAPTVVLANGAWTQRRLARARARGAGAAAQGPGAGVARDRGTGTPPISCGPSRSISRPRATAGLSSARPSRSAVSIPPSPRAGCLRCSRARVAPLPSIEEMEIEAVWTGFRPTSDDDAPILGATPIAGLVIATGHHRNGILLAPVTALAIHDLVTVRRMAGAATRFGLARFAPTLQPREQTDEAQRQWRGARDRVPRSRRAVARRDRRARLAEPKGFAIALNGAVVRRDAWAVDPAAEGDRVEIIRAMQGG